jgi:hypothetical protein
MSSKRHVTPSLQVYFILAMKCNLIKIGSTADLPRRLYEMSTSNPDELKILGVMPGDYTTERTLHRTFKKFRMKGEWFAADQFILDFVEEHCSKSDAVATHLNSESDRQQSRREETYRRRVNKEKLQQMQAALDELGKNWRLAYTYDSDKLDINNSEDRHRIEKEIDARTGPISKEMKLLRGQMQNHALKTGIYIKKLKKEILDEVSRGCYPGYENIVRHAVEDEIPFDEAIKLYKKDTVSFQMFLDQSKMIREQMN